MGLDMYLYKKTYVKNWQHQTPEEQHKITVKRNNKIRKDIDPKKIAYIVEDVGYWRKANAIHKWFIDNCANGDTNQTTVYVSLEDLKELLNTVNTVIQKSILVDGKVHNGTQWTKEKGQEEIYIDGKVIQDRTTAQKLLPTQAGFFFGNTDYNEFYYQDLLDTKKIIEDILLSLIDTNSCSDYEYHASW